LKKSLDYTTMPLTAQEIYNTIISNIDFEAAHWNDDIVNEIANFVMGFNIEEELWEQMDVFKQDGMDAYESMEEHPNWCWSGQFDIYAEEERMDHNQAMLAEYISSVIMGDVEDIYQNRPVVKVE